MKKDEFARELMIGELNKEHGRFVTQRIVDRLAILYTPLFDQQFLAGIAENVNQNERGRYMPAGTRPTTATEEKLSPEKEPSVKHVGRIAAAVSSLLLWLR